MMIKEKLISRVKYSTALYSLYYYLGSFALNIMRWFVRPDDKLILFISLGGRNYDDSPRAIYEAMKKDSRFSDYKMVWGFLHPEMYDLPKAEKIKTDTWGYYKTALKARVWVTNSNVERGLHFKGRKTFYFNTWHGTPIKLMGSDLALTNKSFGSKGKSQVDIMTAQGSFEADIFARVFGINRDKFRIVGLPRNDHYAHYTQDEQLTIRKALHIPAEKRVILYAPTFREYDKNDFSQCCLKLPVNFENWKKVLGDNYVLLFRAHYEVAKSMAVAEDDFIRDVSGYPYLQDLMLVSDLLISDYSSILFDYSIMHKPMYCFVYDYDKYQAERGMYFDLRKFLPNATSENALLEMIKSQDYYDDCQKTIRFQQKFVTEYGNATEHSLNLIASSLLID